MSPIEEVLTTLQATPDTSIMLTRFNYEFPGDCEWEMEIESRTNGTKVQIKERSGSFETAIMTAYQRWDKIMVRNPEVNPNRTITYQPQEMGAAE